MSDTDILLKAYKVIDCGWNQTPMAIRWMVRAFNHMTTKSLKDDLYVLLVETCERYNKHCGEIC